MKMKFTAMIAIMITLAFVRVSEAQTTEFTYQGNLVFNGQTAAGNYDFEFSLFSALAGGTQIGQTIPATNVLVTNGAFTVPLNFGAAFPGADRFLEIKVRPAGGGAYTPLTPRQPISSAPYSIKSQSSETAVNATQLGGVAANQYVLTTDPRLSDARNPLPGNASYIQNDGVCQIRPCAQPASFNVSGTGRAAVFSAFDQFDIGGLRVLDISGYGGTFVGILAGISDQGGESNTFVGEKSGQNVTLGGSNTFSGYASGSQNVTGDRNSFFGNRSGNRSTLSDNSFFGSEAGSENVGFENAYFGSRAGSAQTDGSRNSYFGFQAGQSATGFDNAFFGWQAGRNNTGGGNAMFGRSAGSAIGGGSNNSFFGFQTGNSNTSGQNNVFIGSSAGVGNTTGSNNLVLGANANVSSANLTYATAIGAGAVVTTSNTVMLGRVQETVIAPNRVIVGNQTTARGELSIFANSGNADLYLQGPNTTTGINIAASNDPTPTFFISHYNGTTYTDRLIITPTGTVRIPTLGSAGGTSLCRNASLDIATCSSSARYKTNIADFRSGIDVIRRLRPVTFNWTAGNALDLGLVAEEVAGIDPLLVTYNDKGEVEGVKYDRIGVVLINTVKEQQERIERLEQELRELRQLLIANTKPEKKGEND